MQMPTINDFVYDTIKGNATYDPMKNAYVIHSPRDIVDLITSRTALNRAQVLNALLRLNTSKKIIYRGINNPLTIPSSKPAPQPKAKPEPKKTQVKYAQMSLDDIINNPEKAFEALINDLTQPEPEPQPEPEVKPEPEPEPAKTYNELVADAIEKVVDAIQLVSVHLRSM